LSTIPTRAREIVDTWGYLFGFFHLTQGPHEIPQAEPGDPTPTNMVRYPSFANYTGQVVSIFDGDTIEVVHNNRA
jgi:endonuclease YncB( thermonuclease family)